MLDADGAIIAALRGDGAGIHTLDSAHDKAYTAVSFKNDTLALAERAKGEDWIAPLAKLPHVMFFGGGVVATRSSAPSVRATSATAKFQADYGYLKRS